MDAFHINAVIANEPVVCGSVNTSDMRFPVVGSCLPITIKRVVLSFDVLIFSAKILKPYSSAVSFDAIAALVMSFCSAIYWAAIAVLG